MNTELHFKPADFRQRVTAWFKKHGRDLPWRRTIDPYAILVSEIMCQQTQVATVIPYFERWMLRFPDCRTLAAASEHEVMSLWQGLGYYSRARHLHAAAKAVNGGEFPRTVEEIRALPGVGRYTAGAVAAFAYDKPAALVDANVARVLARIFAVREAGLKRVWEYAETLQPAARGRAFNGGLMEIGALVCTPRSPKCGECPIAEYCAAATEGIQEELPVKKTRKPTVRLDERCAFIVRDGKLLLEHQQGKRWKGLWKLPALEIVPERKPDAVVEYPFTHHVVTLSVYRSSETKSGCEWHSLASIEDVPMASGHRKALRKLKVKS